MKKIIIVEDNIDICVGYKMLINMTNLYEVVNYYHNGADALKNLAKDQPDIALVDIDLPGGMSGIEFTKRLKALFPKVEIIIITVFENSTKVFESLSAGATGYLTKNSNQLEVIEALNQIVKGGSPMSPAIARMVVGSFKKNETNPFTDKELHVLEALVEGKSYKSIASSFEVSIDAIRFHIKNIYLKLQVNSKEDAINKARQNNWV
jgi:DNA-binding NarL/FixJ family response regulator